MQPVRLSVVSCNVWNTTRWPERKDALTGFLSTFSPDILCLQEVRTELIEAIDAALKGHERVRDDFPGWECEGQIYWNRELLERREHGAEDVGILERHRRLFWARLEVRSLGRTLLVGTAHFTWPGNKEERERGLSPRVEQARRTAEALHRLEHAGEPVLFMGDLNDPVQPRRVLSEAGFESCFARLHLPAVSTHPARPTAGGSDQAIDWIVSNDRTRPVAAMVPHYYHEGLAPSDHWPVLSVYEFGPE